MDIDRFLKEKEDSFKGKCCANCDRYFGGMNTGIMESNAPKGWCSYTDRVHSPEEVSCEGWIVHPMLEERWIKEFKK